jgi:hypothetical protein
MSHEPDTHDEVGDDELHNGLDGLDLFESEDGRHILAINEFGQVVEAFENTPDGLQPIDPTEVQMHMVEDDDTPDGNESEALFATLDAQYADLERGLGRPLFRSEIASIAKGLEDQIANGREVNLFDAAYGDDAIRHLDLEKPADRTELMRQRMLDNEAAARETDDPSTTAPDRSRDSYDMSTSQGRSAYMSDRLRGCDMSGVDLADGASTEAA